MIDLHWSDLRVDDDELAARRATLAPDEAARADRYVFDRDNRRFVAGRGLLRAVLGERLDRPPSDVPLSADRWGKPFIVGGGVPLSFNVSHSGDVMVVALGDGRPVGIDVELLRPCPGDVDVARRFFSPAEVAALTALPSSDFDAAFLRVWTRKEAWVKARGQGLSIPLHSFDVSVESGDARLLRTGGDHLAGGRWTLYDLSGAYLGSDVEVTVAALGPPGPICSQLWDRRRRAHAYLS